MSTEVAAIIPVYNSANYLRHTLDSLAKQTRPPDRVIVIDAYSTDNTCDLVRNYQPIQCNLIQNEKNLELFPNMNRSLEFASQTHYLHLLHADDLVHPSFLHNLVPILEKEPRLSFSYSNYEWIDENGQPIEKVAPLPHMSFTQLSRKKFLVQQCELDSIACGPLVFKTNYSTPFSQQLPPCCRRHFLRRVSLDRANDLENRAQAEPNTPTQRQRHLIQQKEHPLLGNRRMARHETHLREDPGKHHCSHNSAAKTQVHVRRPFRSKTTKCPRLRPQICRSNRNRSSKTHLSLAFCAGTMGCQIMPLR